MSFQYSAIGDNTPENRDHLEKLGYRKWMWVSTDNEEPFISTIAHSSEYMAFDNDSLESSAFRDDINCIGNPALFKAVTSMRDDSDKWQFFVHEDGSFVFCDQGELKHVIDNEYMYQEYAVSEFHKATIDEIIKRFTKDENMQ